MPNRWIDIERVADQVLRSVRLPLRSTSLPENPGAATPDAFGPFRVLHQTGFGTLGPVFRAYDPDQDRLVAVKLFTLSVSPEQTQALVARLTELVELDLTHPSLAAPVAAGVANGSAYLAQDFAAADSLDTVMREFGAASAADAARVATQAAGALDSAAAVGVLHGALHPRDLLLTADDTRVTGFGVAQALEVIGVAPPVRSPYTAPERVAGATWDRRADIYSLAVLVTEIMTGKAPSGRAALDDLLATFAYNLRPLGAVLGKALAERPGDRYDTALAFAEAFKAVVHQGTQGAAVGPPSRSPTPPRLDTPLGEPLLPLDGPPHPQTETLLPGDVPASAFDEHPWDAPLTMVTSSEADAGLTLADRPTVAGPDQGGLDWDLPATNRLTAADVDTDLTPGPDVYHTPETRVDTSGVESEPTLTLETAASDLTALSRSAPSPVDATRDAARLGARGGRSILSGPPAAMPAPVSSSSVWPIPLAWMVGMIMGIAVGFFIFGGRNQAGDIAAEPPAVESTSASSGREVPPPPAGSLAPAAESTVAGATATSGTSPAPTPTPTPPRAPATPAPVRETAASPEGAAAAPDATNRSRPKPAVAPTAAATAGGATAGSKRVAAGRLLVRSSPAGARVQVDGRDVGATPLTLRTVSLGPHVLRLSRAGYAAEERRVTVSASQPAQSVVIDLSPARNGAAPGADGAGTRPAAAGTAATLIVESRPGGAAVYVDGRRVGTTPATIDNVRAGQHTVFLELDGFRGWSTSVQVAAGDSNRVSASLEQ